MNVSEETIYHWIEQDKLPASRINGQYRLNRAELLEWATAQRIHIPADIFGEPDKGKTPTPGLSDALKAGGIHYHVGGADKEAALKSAIDLMPLPDDVDKTFLLHVLVARESLGSTGIGDGIAIPHVRNPIVMHIPRPMVTLCFLEQAVEFGALDGKPVHTLFTMVNPTIKAHLSLLSKLAFALSHPPFAGIIARRGTREEILEGAALIDSRVPRRNGVSTEGEAGT